MRAPTPDNEPSRLRALHAMRVLDTDDEAAFDRVTALVSRLLDVPIALVSLVAEDRQWFNRVVIALGSDAERDAAHAHDDDLSRP